MENEDFDEFEALVPESLKKELLSEVDNIRDSMNIINLFTGDMLLTGLRLIQNIEE